VPLQFLRLVVRTAGASIPATIIECSHASAGKLVSCSPWHHGWRIDPAPFDYSTSSPLLLREACALAGARHLTLSSSRRQGEAIRWPECELPHSYSLRLELFLHPLCGKRWKLPVPLKHTFHSLPSSPIRFSRLLRIGYYSKLHRELIADVAPQQLCLHRRIWSGRTQPGRALSPHSPVFSMLPCTAECSHMRLGMIRV
jgi:hypothetical protein